jgi:uncharacterized UPF0160 family protein
MKIKKSIGIHDGSFHADEVSACALLIHFGLADADKVIRTRSYDKLEECEYVCDVGGVYDPLIKRFDHHQADYKGDLSSAGMVLNYLQQSHLLSNALFDHLNHSWVLGVDAHDNGRYTADIGTSTFSHIIANFMPIHYEASEKELNDGFKNALDFTLAHLHRMVERFFYIRSCKQEVANAMQASDEVLYFDHLLPWMDLFFELGGDHHPARFVIMPSASGWKLRGIPPNSRDRMKVRQPLPEKWAGLLDEKLAQVSGIQGAVFCHKGRFISVWKTKEDAELALKKIIKNHSL